MRAAAEDLTAAGQLVFTRKTLEQQVRALSPKYTALTVKQAIRVEAAAAEGCLAWARSGWYRLATTQLPSGAAEAVLGPLGRPRVPLDCSERTTGSPQPTRSAPAVLVALEHLLPEGDPNATVCRRDVEEYLRGAGVPYQGRAVRLGIAEVLDEAESEFVRLRGWKIARSQMSGPPER